VQPKDLLDWAAAIAGQALAAGADAAEAYLSRSWEREIKVRLGRLERTVEASGTGCGLRVDRGARQGFASTTELSSDGIRRLVETALALAAQAPEDPHGALPSRPPDPPPVLDLFDPAVPEVPFERGVELAAAAEEAALASDPRLTAGEGSAFVHSCGEIAVANTRGPMASFSGTRCSLACVPTAGQGAERQRQYWYEGRRFIADLPPAAEVGILAAGRAVRMLGARPLPAGRARVILDPLEAARFWSSLVPALLGDAARRGVSFLSSELGRQVASSVVTLVEDPHVPRAPGSRPIDGEGWPTSRRTILDRGVLHSFLYDTRTARRAGTVTTGSAQRGYASPPAPGAHALRLAPGDLPPERILAEAGSGLYVTHLIGFGVNIVTGDYSRGANGWWFERGEFAHPVQEVTLSGNLRDMLRGVALIGNDLVFRAATNSPTILIEGMVVSGGGR